MTYRTKSQMRFQKWHKTLLRTIKIILRISALKKEVKEILFSCVIIMLALWLIYFVEHEFVLLSPKDVDVISKSYLQEVLQMYMAELPGMSYAANTGKQSKFLERCVTNGKYRTLLLKSSSAGDSGKVIAAITYQIIPADTEYAEIPLAAVNAIYQQKVISGLEKVNETSTTFFVTCEEDIEEAMVTSKKGIRTFSSEWFMNCVMRQGLDLEASQFAGSL
ncbi:uncharacterized protein [Cicer arietinum]|uniref:Uncharacterized protein LOC101489596 isoform X2 n=1 Tax=Cicer arietinum TaxID=3827 RepID=A0A1S2XSV7_CICAR|nr:uncharacterized protein LOC101489596 isoform X2 [Cicer arietinum]XP_012569321.1 uncharacterized protein LOC101489596 isoform X2 [Cicer arietinum]